MKRYWFRPALLGAAVIFVPVAVLAHLHYHWPEIRDECADFYGKFRLAWRLNRTLESKDYT